MISLNLPSGRMELKRADLLVLRDAAAAQAGRSSAARDLSLLLARALEPGQRIALRRGELAALIHVAKEAGLDALAARLEAAASKSTT